MNIDPLMIFTLLGTVIGLIIYLCVHEWQQQIYIRKIQNDLSSLPMSLQRYYSDMFDKQISLNQKMIGEVFTKHLSHIEKLERMTLPKPVTEKDVRAVMKRMGKIVDESAEVKWENEIEKAEKLPEPLSDDWTGHITSDTKIAFEGYEEVTA